MAFVAFGIWLASMVPLLYKLVVARAIEVAVFLSCYIWESPCFLSGSSMEESIH